MIAVITVLFVLALSLVVVRVATVALTLTGLSKDLAEFQALSAFTGSGFTTRESEEVMTHPLRRRITMHLMLLGNAGIVIAASSMIISFVNHNTGGGWTDSLLSRLLILCAGVGAFWVLATSAYVDRVMWRINRWAVKCWTHMDVRDYTRLLRFSHEYVVSELQVAEGDWLDGRTLFQCQLPSEGVLVLGIEKADGKYVGAPRGQAAVTAGDCLVLYGTQRNILDLGTRRADPGGDRQHKEAVQRQEDSKRDKSDG